MIKIEDEEDIDAYREAKAEIDDEFREDDVVAATETTSRVPDEEVQQLVGDEADTE